MKKFALITAIVGLAYLSYGQGFVNFGNSSGTTPFFTNSITTIYGQPSDPFYGQTTGADNKSSSGDRYFFTLLFLPYSGSGASNGAVSATTLLSQGWIWSGIYASNNLALGGISGGSVVETTNVGSNPDAVGAANQFIVVGWSASLAGGGNPNNPTSWLTISNDLAIGFAGNNTLGYLGISMTGTGVGAAAPAALPEPLFNTAAGGTAIFGTTTLFAVPVLPEPSTIALAALGGVSLLLFRRRK